MSGLAKMGGFFGGVATFFFDLIVRWFGTKAAMTTALVTAWVAATTAAFLCLQGFFSLLDLAPDGLGAGAGTPAAGAMSIFWMAFGSLWPSNANTVIAVCIGADACVFLWRYKLSLLNAISGTR